jgi:hypothetical protein
MADSELVKDLLWDETFDRALAQVVDVLVLGDDIASPPPWVGKWRSSDR